MRDQNFCPTCGLRSALRAETGLCPRGCDDRMARVMRTLVRLDIAGDPNFGGVGYSENVPPD